MENQVIKGVAPIQERGDRTKDTKERFRNQTEETAVERKRGDANIAALEVESETRKAQEKAEAAKLRGELAVRGMNEDVFNKMMKESQIPEELKQGGLPEMTYEQFKNLPVYESSLKDQLQAAKGALEEQKKNAGWFGRFFNREAKNNIQKIQAKIDAYNTQLEGLPEIMRQAKAFQELEDSRAELSKVDEQIDTSLGGVRIDRQRERQEKAGKVPRGFGR
ncbi:MAG: hypothetical protein ABH846_01120 [Patescibacteria group bacterium]